MGNSGQGPWFLLHIQAGYTARCCSEVNILTIDIGFVFNPGNIFTANSHITIMGNDFFGGKDTLCLSYDDVALIIDIAPARGFTDIQ